MLSQGSGMVIMTASGRSMPLMTRNSRVLSSMAESEPAALTTGRTLFRSFFRWLGLHGLLPGQHLVRIAPDGIDLAVVYDETVGMGPLPAGVGIGTETGMYDGDGRLVIRHPADPGRRNAADVPGTFPCIQWFCWKGIPRRCRRWTARRSGGPHRASGRSPVPFPRPPDCFTKPCMMHGIFSSALLPKDRRHGGNLSPAQELHALFFHNDLEHLPGLVALQLILGEEEHSDTVISFFT